MDKLTKQFTDVAQGNHEDGIVVEGVECSLNQIRQRVQVATGKKLRFETIKKGKSIVRVTLKK